MDLLNIQRRYARMGIGDLPQAVIERAMSQAGYVRGRTTERGTRATPEAAVKYLFRSFWIDPELRATILDVRHMDRVDPRVKRIHGRMSRAAVKGGLILEAPGNAESLHGQWRDFAHRLGLGRQEKLESDCRGLTMEGNLPMQWVLDESRRVVKGVRMPTETLVANVGPAGRFLDPRKAYEQWDLQQGAVLDTFALWQLTVVRLTPDNFDDMGSFGRPYLDAARTPWKKLVMSEEDLVVRRRTRAPQRLSHILEGASKEDLQAYEQKVSGDIEQGNYRDFFSNRKGGVNALQGDANLDQIADVVHLLDTFFSGAPAPKGLFGYSDQLNRDILEDLKADFFDELDSLQDTLSTVYEMGFRLDLLLQGIDPDAQEFRVRFAERRTETPNQAADRALKIQALGASTKTVMRTAGLDSATEVAQRADELRSRDPYPEPGEIGAPENPTTPRVSITPGNRPKGESGTEITTGAG